MNTNNICTLSQDVYYIVRHFYFVEDEDDVSVVTTRTAAKKRKYSESTLDAMSLKSQSMSRYQGKFISFYIVEYLETFGFNLK